MKQENHVSVIMDEKKSKMMDVECLSWCDEYKISQQSSTSIQHPSTFEEEYYRPSGETQSCNFTI